MKRVVSEGVIQLTRFAAGVFATGAVWYFLSPNEFTSAALPALAAIALATVAVYLQRLNDRSAQYRKIREQLATFLKEAEVLGARANEQPLPIAEHNAWVSRVEAYLSVSLDASFAARFGNFSGMTLFATFNPNSGYESSLEARSRRLHEFISEFGQ